jgi:hypothetical protein
MAAAYRGGFWDMYALSNDGWYMCPSSEATFTVTSQNGYSGEMSADALGTLPVSLPSVTSASGPASWPNAAPSSTTCCAI